MASKNPSLTPMARFDYGLYAAVVVIWGSSWIALRMHLGTIGPEVSVMWRFLIAFVATAAWAIAVGQPLRFPLALHLRFALLGLFLFSTNLVMFYHGGLTTPSGLLAVVFSLASIFNLIIGAALARRRPNARLLVGGLIGVLGSGLMFAPQLAGHTFTLGTFTGLAFCIIGTLCFCVGNLISASIQKAHVPVLSANAWGMFYGAAALLAYNLVTGAPIAIDVSARYIGALLFLSIVGSVVAFASYLTLLGRIGAARAGYSTVMYPVIALALSTLLEGYQWTGFAAAGLVAVILGNMLVLGNGRTHG